MVNDYETDDAPPVIPIHEGRPTVVDEQLAETEGDAPVRNGRGQYSPAGTQAGGPKSLMQRLEERAAEAEERATRLHQASEDPENDDEVRAAFAEFADLVNQIKALEQEQTPTVQWDDLSTDDKLNALAQAQVETQKYVADLGAKLQQFGEVLFRILVKAGEINEDGTPIDNEANLASPKRTESGIVLPD